MRNSKRIENDPGTGPHRCKKSELPVHYLGPDHPKSQPAGSWRGPWQCSRLWGGDLGVFYSRKIWLGASLMLLTCVLAQSLSSVWLSVTRWTVGCRAPLLSPPPGALPHPGIKTPELAGGFFTSESPGKSGVINSDLREGSDPSSLPGLAPGTPPSAAPSVALASHHRLGLCP